MSKIDKTNSNESRIRNGSVSVLSPINYRVYRIASRRDIPKIISIKCFLSNKIDI